MASINIESLNNSLKFGTPTGFTEIEPDGTISLKGSASCWDDITSNLIARKLETTTGKLQYNYSENTIIMESGGIITTSADTLMFNYQIRHNSKLDSIMKLHIHYEQDTSVTREFSIKYRIQKNNYPKNTTWNEVVVQTNTNNVFAYTSGILNQICSLTDVDLTGASISDIVQFQVCRTDLNTGNLQAVFIDAHYEIDTFGSREEFVK